MSVKKVMLSIVLLVFMVSSIVMANYAVNPTSTGYYLMEGYKISAKVYVPDTPLWGNTIGDVFGISCEKYMVYAMGWGEKTWNWECKHGIKVVWREGGNDQDKSYVDLAPNKKHDVTIVYDWDGTIKISVDGKFVYSFVATEKKYQVIAQGAQVSPPEALPKPDGDKPTGSGYNPSSVKDLEFKFILLGIGVAAILFLVILFVVLKKK